MFFLALNVKKYLSSQSHGNIAKILLTFSFAPKFFCILFYSDHIIVYIYTLHYKLKCYGSKCIECVHI